MEIIKKIWRGDRCFCRPQSEQNLPAAERKSLYNSAEGCRVNNLWGRLFIKNACCSSQNNFTMPQKKEKKKKKEKKRKLLCLCNGAFKVKRKNETKPNVDKNMRTYL